MNAEGTMVSEVANSLQSEVTRVTVKLPPYWTNDPTLCFAQVEAQFAIGGIKDQQTKFHYVISQLPPETAAEVRDLILAPPTEPYKTLKETLIKRTSETAAQRIKKALAATEVGDARPTQILRALQQNLEGMKADDKLLLQFFIQKLPATVRSIVAAQSDKMQLSALADLADRVYEHMPENVSVSAVSSSSSSSSSSAAWEQRMSRLETMMEKLLNMPSEKRSANSRGHSRSNSRTRFNPQGKLCYYHWRFKDRANKCTSPCSWKPRNVSPSKNANLQ